MNGKRSNLAMFIAFQMIRTRQQREQFTHMEQLVKEHLEKHGGKIEDIEGYEPLTDERLTREHVEFIKHSTGGFAEIIAQKDFVLLEAAQGRSFYLERFPHELTRRGFPLRQRCDSDFLLVAGGQHGWHELFHRI